MAKKLQFWAPLVAGGLLLGVSSSFLVFGSPLEMEGAIQWVKNRVGHNVCPPGTQKGKFLGTLPPGSPLEATSARPEEVFCVAPAAMQEPEWKSIF